MADRKVKKRPESSARRKSAQRSTGAKANTAKTRKKQATKKRTARSPARAKSAKSASRGTSPGLGPKSVKKASAPPTRKVGGERPVDKPTSEAAAVSPARQRVTGGKILSREFLQEVGDAVRKAVRPAIAAAKGREIAGTAPSGDVTFELDRIAEKALLGFLKRTRKPVAYYSEDSGYTTFSSGQPQNLMVIDPIDGTRAARRGFEGCVVSLCSTRVIERPTFARVDNAMVMEILGKRTFYAERDRGARMYVDGHPRKIKLSENTDLESVSWSMTVPARPAELIFPVAAKVIDLTSLKGGFFACNSTSFSLTRLVSSQLDACVDFANRFYRDIPEVVADYFINAGRGVVMGVCPYDFVGALLIATEAGCTVTDAYGNGFDDMLLLDSSIANHRSVIAAANAELHEKLFNFFDTRIEQYEALLKRRHEQRGGG